MLPLVLATANPHKVEELRAIFGGAGLPVVGLNDLPGPFTEPAETGATFEANATAKALSYARQTGRACIADDSGLEVDALGGAPGVISSHYSTRGLDTGLTRAERDAANNEALLDALAGVPPPGRTARFVCVMALALPNAAIVTRGVLPGLIGLPPSVPRGRRGFGYDPLFVLADGRTTAELSPAEKNAISHRAQAARRMAARISESGILRGA